MLSPQAVGVPQGTVSWEQKAGGDQEAPRLVSLSQDRGLRVKEIPLEPPMRVLIPLGEAAIS